MAKCLRSVLLAFGLVIPLTSSELFALATEEVGNAPLAAANYRDWPGIMPMVNHPTRVYQIWVNGNEHMYYLGDTQSLNDFLRKFAQVEIGHREVLVRPGPGSTQSFDGKEMPYDWNLHLVGGIAAGMTRSDRGSKIWSRFPMVTVMVGSGIRLDQLVIPQGVEMLELSDLTERYREGIQSTDRTVRGWGANRLAQLDPFDTRSLELVAKLLDDEDPWVQLNAAGAVVQFGKLAQPTLPALRRCAASDDQRLAQRAVQSIQEIENAPDRSSQREQHLAALVKIRQFRKSREGSPEP